MQIHNDQTHDNDMIDLDEIMVLWLLDVGKLCHCRGSLVWVDEETSLTQFQHMLIPMHVDDKMQSHIEVVNKGKHSNFNRINICLDT